MKKLHYIIATLVMLGCSHQPEHYKFIQGDWNTGIVPEFIKSPDKGIDTLYTYYEYAFTNEYIYTFSDQGPITPSRYEIKKDSMFFYHLINSKKVVTTSGRIVIINDDQFNLITDFATFKNYRLEVDKKGLSNYVIPDSMEKTIRFKNLSSFAPIFNKRYYETLDMYMKNEE